MVGYKSSWEAENRWKIGEESGVMLCYKLSDTTGKGIADTNTPQNRFGRGKGRKKGNRQSIYKRNTSRRRRRVDYSFHEKCENNFSGVAVMWRFLKEVNKLVRCQTSNRLGKLFHGGDGGVNCPEVLSWDSVSGHFSKDWPVRLRWLVNITMKSPFSKDNLYYLSLNVS